MAASPAPLRLEWQWNRPAEHALLMKVAKIAPESSGFFGIRRSPSMADALPDAQMVSGKALSGDAVAQGVEVVVRLPKHELPAMTAGDVVAVAYTADAAAVRMAVAPAGADAAWLAGWLHEK